MRYIAIKLKLKESLKYYVWAKIMTKMQKK